MLKKLDFGNNPYIGVYSRSTENRLFISPSATKKEREEMERALGISASVLTLGSSIVIGSLMCANSSGAVVTGFIDRNEMKALGGLNVLVLRHKLNAAGNNILANDHGCLVHPGYDDATTREIGEALGVKTVKGTIAGLRTVGSVAVATNRGVACHPNISEKETLVLERTLGVPSAVSTANYGVAHIGACLVANSKGAVVGTRTTPVELGRIEEALKLY